MMKLYFDVLLLGVVETHFGLPCSGFRSFSVISSYDFQNALAYAANLSCHG